MKVRLQRILAAFVLLCCTQLLVTQQPPDNASPEIIAIRQKIANGTPLTPEETQAIQQFRAERAKAVRDAYLKDHTPQSSTGLIALPDLGTGMYKGEQGGLYPGGSNTVPTKHLRAGVKLARRFDRSMRVAIPPQMARLFCWRSASPIRLWNSPCLLKRQARKRISIPTS